MSPLLRRPWRRAPTADTALDPLPAELLCDGLARVMNARGEDHTEEHVASHPGARSHLGATTERSRFVYGLYAPARPTVHFLTNCEHVCAPLARDQGGTTRLHPQLN